LGYILERCIPHLSFLGVVLVTIDLSKILSPEGLKYLARPKGYRQSEEFSKAISKGVRRYWDTLSPEEYDRRCGINEERWTGGNERDKAAERSREQWVGYSEERRQEILGKVFLNEDYREAFAEARRNMTAEEAAEWVERSFWKPEVLSGRGNVQTFPERVVELWLEEHRPGEWKYTGAAKEVIIGGRAPDFINMNGKKEVIEVFGEYWHPESDVEQRIAHYRKYGFDCKVIWDYECLPREIEKILEGGA